MDTFAKCFSPHGQFYSLHEHELHNNTDCRMTVSIQEEFASGTLTQASADALMMKSLKEILTPSKALNSRRSCVTASISTSTER